ncbi:MAG: sulfatase [Deltaproteobacteria bacterium]|nr:sulfatase [Deltaproteobacteria bacterium]
MTTRPSGSWARELRAALALGASAGVTWGTFEDVRIMARRFHVLGTLTPENLALLRPEVLLEAMGLYAALFATFLVLVTAVRAVLGRPSRDETSSVAELMGWILPFFLLMAWRLAMKLALAGNPYLTKVPNPSAAQWAAFAAVSLGVALGVGGALARVARVAFLAPLFRVAFHARLAALLVVLLGLPSVYPLIAVPRPAETALGRKLDVERDAGAPARDWNVLVVVLDTTRADHLTPYGYARDTTPFLTTLAAQGVLFENARTVAPWTLPAHTSLFTGLYPASHHVLAKHLFLAADVPTLAEVLGSAGYQTACFTNNPWLGGLSGTHRGFAHFEPVWKQLHALHHSIFDLLPLRVLADFRSGVHDDGSAFTLARVRSWLDDRDPARPFFAFVNLMEAHQPNWNGPGSKRYLPSDLTEKDLADMRMDSKLYESGRVKLDARQLQIQKDLYDGELTYLDGQLARLIDSLRDAGALDRTLLVITADHGELFGEQGQMGHQFALWEPLLHVPLIVVAPDHPEVVARGVRSDYPAQLVDVPATVTRLLGVRAAGFAREGISLAPVLAGTGRPDPRKQLAQYEVPDFAIRVFHEVYPELEPWSFGGDLAALIDGPWKVIQRFQNGSRTATSLYRLPDEGTDLARDEPATLDVMTQTLDGWLAEHKAINGVRPAGGARTMTPEEIQAMKALGYAG